MARRDLLKRAVTGLALVALLAAMHSADAQRRRLPSRTEPIPDTETGGKAGTAGANEPRNPSMMIYGPPVAPLGAPPSAPIPPAVVKPAPEVAPPPAPIAAPAPQPAPVVTPTPPAPAPVAVPIPAPAPPPPPVAAPAPVPPPPVAVPAPAPPPVAAPAPVVVPPPAPAPVAVPAPVIAPPPPPVPVAAPKPVPPPLAKPAPAPEKREIAIVAPAPAPFAAPKLDAKLVEQIFSCLAPGLPQDWKRTWVVVSNAGGVATKFYATSSYRDEDAEEYVPCNAQEITRRITGLSDTLPAEQRRWSSARLAIDSEGRYELKYDYSR